MARDARDERVVDGQLNRGVYDSQGDREGSLPAGGCNERTTTKDGKGTVVQRALAENVEGAAVDQSNAPGDGSIPLPGKGL